MRKKSVRDESIVLDGFTSTSFISELWRIFHDELDLDGNGHLDSRELELALEHAGTSSYVVFSAKTNPIIRYHITSIYPCRLHDLSLKVASFTCYQLHGISGLPSSNAPASIYCRNLPLLRGA
jgi:hypothetical protein